MKINNFGGDITDMSAKTKTRAAVQLCLDEPDLDHMGSLWAGEAFRNRNKYCTDVLGELPYNLDHLCYKRNTDLAPDVTGLPKHAW